MVRFPSVAVVHAQEVEIFLITISLLPVFSRVTLFFMVTPSFTVPTLNAWLLNLSCPAAIALVGIAHTIAITKRYLDSLETTAF